MNNRLASVLLLVLVIAALAIAPLASAQGGPQAVGLRPDAPPYARHGPYWVGVQQFEAETPTHATKVMVWYPALNPEGAEEVTTYYGDYDPDVGAWPITYHSLQDAAPDPSGGPYPLVVYVHGLYAQRHSGKWLGDHLATYGFVVIAIDQIDNMGTANDATVFPGAWVARPQDVSWQIDLAGILTAGGGILEGIIDADQVVVIGHSFGGYTTLVAGGARLDWDYYRTWCDQNRERTLSPGLGGNLCDMMNVQAALAPLFGQDASQSGLWPSLSDPRVDAIVPMAPVYWPLFGPEGMGMVTVPMLFMGGTGDTVLTPPEWEPFYTSAASEEKALVLFDYADHMLFLYGCDDAPWYVESGLFSFCSDPVWDMDRAHDVANHFVTAFLLATLKGDTDAAAALAPDAVSFPGITYEATGF